MDNENIWLNKMPLPVILRGALNAYTTEIKKALEVAECPDLSQNGCLVVCNIAHECNQLTDIIKELGISKQVASQLVDTLVAKGCLVRSDDPADRRRMMVALTEKGQVASSTVTLAIDRVDEALLKKLDESYVAHTRDTLVSLMTINHDGKPEQNVKERSNDQK